MGKLKIIDAKVVGLCSKHRGKNDEIPTYKDGKIVEDKDIACVACSLGSQRIEDKDHKAPVIEGENEVEKLVNSMCEGYTLRQHEYGKILKYLYDKVKEIELTLNIIIEETKNGK